jgi:hypothetical protein
MLDPELEGDIFHQNVSNDLSLDTALLSRGLRFGKLHHVDPNYCVYYLVQKDLCGVWGICTEGNLSAFV